jgi:hypothetical protein
MTETAITRLKAATDPWAPGAQEHMVTIPRADMDELLRRFSLLCEQSPDTDHHACQYCGDTLCMFCSDVDPAGCEDRHTFEDHCLGCVGQCPACAGRCVA